MLREKFKWSTRQKEIRANWKLILALGLTGIAAFHICVYIAPSRTTAINALIILSTSPIVIVIIFCFVFNERIIWCQGIGIFISLLGTLILICRGDIETLVNFRYNRGDIWMGLAFLFWNKGVDRIGPVKAGMYIHFMPLFGAALSILLLNEALTMFHKIGALFVGIGVLLTNKQKWI